MSRPAARRATGRARRALAFVFVSASAYAQDAERVSVDSSGAQAIHGGAYPRISANGQVVVFVSDSPDLVFGDSNNVADIFVHDRTTGITERVSVSSFGAEANGASDLPAISADGQFVAFHSGASNLVTGDKNGWWDVFVHDRSSGITERVSVDSSGAEANSSSLSDAISADGQIVAFSSFASNLVSSDSNGAWDVFVRDRTAGVTTLVSVDSSGTQGNGDSMAPGLSADGLFVAFSSTASNLVSGDANWVSDVFVFDRSRQTTERVSVDSNGHEANDASYEGALSSDGAIVAFSSNSSDLVSGDKNKNPDIFVHDRTTGATERVSVDSQGREGNYFSMSATLSADGRVVAFASGASNLVTGDTNNSEDIFTHDRSTGVTERESVDSSGAQADRDSQWPWISADGLAVAFESLATNLVANDTNFWTDAFVHDHCNAFATWSNWGSGFAGTHGVPAITSRNKPVIGSTITVDVDNSLAAPTVGLFFVGFSQQSLHSALGGDLLVDPAVTVFITFWYSGDSFMFDVPDDLTLCGLAVDIQVIEVDAGAAHGVSFTPGLELAIGH